VRGLKEAAFITRVCTRAASSQGAGCCPALAEESTGELLLSFLTSKMRAL
jgi:hypothetical protein